MTQAELKAAISAFRGAQDELSALKSRINQLADQVHVLQQDVRTFKKNVAKDVTYLTDRVENS